MNIIKNIRDSAGWRGWVLIVLAALEGFGQGSAPARTAHPRTPRPKVLRAVNSDVSPPLSSLMANQPGTTETFRQIRVRRNLGKPLRTASAPREAWRGDPALQTSLPSEAMPDPIVNFDGISELANFPAMVLPPDTEGDVGPNHYVQWVNLVFAVFDKTGALLAGPSPGNTLWKGFGGLCETSNEGDPIVKYDAKADRWLMSQLAGTRGPFYQCIAISQTPDPTGAFYRYAFQVSETKANDYPKFGVWPDAYYLSFLQFVSPTRYGGEAVAALERDKMLNGDPDVRMVLFDLFDADPDLGGMLPSDSDGPSPPDGSPNPFVEVDFPEGYPTDRSILQVFQFHVDWDDPSNSTFDVEGKLVLETDPFNANLCFAPPENNNCIPQPGVAPKLEALSDRLMYRLQYRNFDDHESLVMNHTVNVDTKGGNRAGVRWYELRKRADCDWAIFQQGTYAPDDGDHRWMGSIAQDSSGNIALGFSVSGDSTFPSIRYVGRLVDDPPGTLTEGETSLIEGTGVQLHPTGRWGDYSVIAVDPTDDCTFWYTQEYYLVPSPLDWQTRIGSFAFPSCSLARSNR